MVNAPPDDFDATDDDASQRKSRSQKKRDAHALYDVGEQLVALSNKVLATMPLDDAMREAVVACRPLKKNARNRQLRLIAKLLRQTDSTAIVERMSETAAQYGQEVLLEQGNEAWRTRLLAEGDQALTELVDEHPEADVAALRSMIREAKKEPETARTVRAKRELLRAVRALRATKRPEADVASSD